MERWMEIFEKLAFVLLVVWVVMAGLGMTAMPGEKKQAIQTAIARPRARGLIWARPVVQAPMADGNLAYPAAPVM